MVKPFSLQSLRWSGSGLLVLVSLGFHGLLLAMPTPQPATSPEAVMTLAPSVDDANPGIAPTETVEVVRLPTPPAAPEPAPAVAPAQPSTLAALAPQAAPSVFPQTAPPAAAPPAAAPPAVDRSAAPESPAPESPAPEPDPPAPAPVPPGLVHNNKTVDLVTDTRDFLAWYTDQDWTTFDLEPLPAPKELTRLQVPYGGEVCLSIPPTPGRLEVIVGNDGQIYRAPRLLATTGYDDLDAAALALAAQQTYADAANPSLPNPTVYWLPMEVIYQGPTCPPSN